MSKGTGNEVAGIRERVVVLENDTRSADILPVIDANAERVVAGKQEMSIPLKDMKEFITPEGRLYVLSAPEWYVDETRRLAELEMSTVIGQAVNYQRPGVAAPKGNPFLKILPWILAAAMLLLYFMKK